MFLFHRINGGERSHIGINFIWSKQSQPEIRFFLPLFIWKKTYDDFDLNKKYKAWLIYVLSIYFRRRGKEIICPQRIIWDIDFGWVKFK